MPKSFLLYCEESNGDDHIKKTFNIAQSIIKEAPSVDINIFYDGKLIASSDIPE